jgi:hypothetical protein
MASRKATLQSPFLAPRILAFRSLIRIQASRTHLIPCSRASDRNPKASVCLPNAKCQDWLETTGCRVDTVHTIEQRLIRVVLVPSWVASDLWQGWCSHPSPGRTGLQRVSYQSVQIRERDQGRLEFAPPPIVPDRIREYRKGAGFPTALSVFRIANHAWL